MRIERKESEVTFFPRMVTVVAVVFLVALALTGSADAQERRFDLGVRFDALTAGGEPANDMLGLGVFGRYRLDDRWRVGLGIDYSEFDLERPALIVGLPADFSGGVVDGAATSTTLSVWLERVYGAGRAREWFWTAGFGGAAIDVDDVTGPLEGGGAYTLSTSFDGELGVEEVLVSVSGGLRLRVGGRSAVEIALRADQHIADWEVVDQVSGATGRSDDYLARGVTVGWVSRF
jgi:hypothetical protein